jgi:hypothetical protein
MKTYSHYRKRAAPRVQLLLLSVLGLGALAGLAWSLTNDIGSGPPFPVFLAAMIVIGINLWILGGTALEIRLGDDGHVELVAPLRSVRVAVLDIVSIAPSEALKGAVFVLKHRDGSLRFDPKLDGMHELISELVRQNPRIELRGI